MTLRKVGDAASVHLNSDFTLGGGAASNSNGSPLDPQSPQLSFADQRELCVLQGPPLEAPTHVDPRA